MSPGSVANPTGAVDFTQGATDLTPGGVLLTGGVATFSISSLAQGNNTITATYTSSDAEITNGSPGTGVQDVQDTSSTVVTFTPASPAFGGTVKFTATVSPGTTAVTPTGTVNFLDGATTLASGKTLAAGKCHLLD